MPPISSIPYIGFWKYQLIVGGTCPMGLSIPYIGFETLKGEKVDFTIKSFNSLYWVQYMYCIDLYGEYKNFQFPILGSFRQI